jgi:membrane-associated protease RseP (regulator of RpoE activity)
MSEPSPTRGPARETRLLLLTLCVSVAVLFLLARFRFPERPISELATPQPLTRLARSTTFDDLSATLKDLLHQADGAIVVMRVSAPIGAGASGTRLVPALRVRDDLAVAMLQGDARVEAIDDLAVSANAIVARDEVRGLALVRVPPLSAPALSVQPQSEALDLPGFLVVMDAAPGGPAIRAEFVSRVSTRAHPAWDTAVLALGGVTNVRPGAAVFTLAGRFVGIVLNDHADHDETVIAPGETVIARATRLTEGESVLAANTGLSVQPLSPALAKATKATNGVVIAAMSNQNALRVGDVIAAIDNDSINSVGDWERVLSRRAPGTTILLHIVRRNGKLQVRLTLTWRDAPLAPGDDGAAAAAASAKRSDANAGTLGLTLRALPGGVVQVQRVEPDSAAARAGLQAGDRITALPTASASASATSASATSASPPTPLSSARVERAFQTLAHGDALMLAIDRAGQPLIVAIEKP